MKINIVMGHFLPVPPVAGGAMEKTWFRLGSEMAARGHQVTLISRAWAGYPRREILGQLRMRRVPGFDHTKRIGMNLIMDGVWGLRVQRQLPDADVTVCNTVSLPVYLSLVARRTGATVVVLARMPKGQVRLYRRASLLIAVSGAVKSRVAQECPSAVARTRVIPLPIDWGAHASASTRSQGAVHIGYIGRIHPEKGLDLLLQAACRLVQDPTLPPWKLVIRGPESVAMGGGGARYVESLRRRYDGDLKERLEWAPAEFDTQRLARCYGRLDIFCYPSIAERGEALGVAPLEAMAAGAVPVLSGLDCFREMLAEGVNGFSFNHRGAQSSAALACVLSNLIRDDGLRRETGARAQVDSRSFDFGVIASRMLAEFREVAFKERSKG